MMTQSKVLDVSNDKEEVWDEVSAGSVGEYWKPTEDKDTIIGVLTGHQDGALGRTYIIDVKGTMVGLPSNVALTGALAKVSVGSLVRIVYLGTETSKNKREYKTFSVAVRRQEPSFN